MELKSRSSRRWAAGILLAAFPVAAAVVCRGLERPWAPACPSYRQLGGAGARVVVVEFSDFQCPHCAAAAGAAHEIEARFGSKVRFYYKYLPWTDMHRWAKDAALAAECAGKQGKFWPMHDLLFSRQGEWAPSDDAPGRFESYAGSLSLDLPAFGRCIRDPATAAAVQADIQDAKEHWVRSTPTFFVDGRRLVGAQQLRLFGLPEIARRAL